MRSNEAREYPAENCRRGKSCSLLAENGRLYDGGYFAEYKWHIVQGNGICIDAYNNTRC